MILSLVTVPLQFLGLRYRTLPFFLKGYIPLPSVRGGDTIVTSFTELYKRYKALQNVTFVTERYIRNLRIFENLNKKTNEHVSK